MATSTPSQPLRHIFVLMLENRSFDHMLGFSGLSGTDAETGAPTKVVGLSGSEFNLHAGPRVGVSEGADFRMPIDPGHEFAEVLQQLCGTGVAYRRGGAYPPIDD